MCAPLVGVLAGTTSRRWRSPARSLGQAWRERPAVNLATERATDLPRHGSITSESACKPHANRVRIPSQLIVIAVTVVLDVIETKPVVTVPRVPQAGPWHRVGDDRSLT